MPEPIHLPLFPEIAALTRFRPERNEWCFNRLAVWPDVFGRALLARRWGRIGTQGRMRLEPHRRPERLARLAPSKRREAVGSSLLAKLAYSSPPCSSRPRSPALARGGPLNLVHGALPTAKLARSALLLLAKGHRDLVNIRSVDAQVRQLTKAG